MKNLEQVRAFNALEAVKQGGFSRKDINGIPALVQSCGLLATAAFVSTGQKARDGMWKAMDAVARHLRDPLVGPRLTMPPSQVANETKAMLRELAEKQSSALIAATTETIAFLSYLKRFAPKP